MTNLLKNREDMLKAIGLFTVNFSNLEFLLLELCTYTLLPLIPDGQFITFIGFTLEDKRKTINKFISIRIPVLAKEWKVINDKICDLNRNRRFLIHGFIQTGLYDEKVKTICKVNGKIVINEYSAKDINDLSNLIGHINTGENGIGGVFNSKFKTEAINKYNLEVEDKFKIVFKENDVIKTDWKG